MDECCASGVSRHYDLAIALDRYQSLTRRNEISAGNFRSLRNPSRLAGYRSTLLTGVHFYGKRASLPFSLSLPLSEISRPGNGITVLIEKNIRAITILREAASRRGGFNLFRGAQLIPPSLSSFLFLLMPIATRRFLSLACTTFHLGWRNGSDLQGCE